MNIILFDASEGKSPVLPQHDRRAEHLTKILHKKAGDTFLAGVIGGQRGQGKIASRGADGSLFLTLNVNEPVPKRSPLYMSVGFPRQIQLRRILRALSGMGCAQISLFSTEFGEKSYMDTKLLTDGGAREALLEGAEQSRDTILPELAVYTNFDEWLAAEKASGRMLLAADWTGSEPSFTSLPALTRPATLAVGNERGFSADERQKLDGAGFKRLSLGTRALRTETACVAAAALVLSKMGLM